MAKNAKPQKDEEESQEGAQAKELSGQVKEVDEVAKELIQDLFEHQEFARSLVNHLENFRGGKVVSLRAPWGRGKTDVLNRVYEYARERKKDARSPLSAVVWVNPWQYGNADLLSPLLHALIAAIPKEELEKEQKEIARILTSLLAAASGAALKAATGLDGAADLASKLLDGLLGAKGAPGYSDPVASVGVAFKELITRFVARNSEKPQVLIIVDDIDRCLPARQIALLEAFHFLVDAQAPATFLMAIDGAILGAAARTHYQDQQFSADRYLDKIFDFNLDLPQLTSEKLRAFSYKVYRELTELPRESRMNRLPEVHEFMDTLQAAVLADPQFRNPRTLTRFLDKLIAYFRLNGDLPGHGEPLDIVLFLLLVTQNWPETRFLLDYAIARGATDRSGTAEEQAVQAVVEYAKSTQALPFHLFRGDKMIQIGERQATVKNLIKSYLKVTESLSEKGL